MKNLPDTVAGGHEPTRSPFKVLIVGAGLGGLSCAISCLRHGLDVQILEKSKVLAEVGAGIQLPPNAMRVMHYYDLADKLFESGPVEIMAQSLRRYSDGDMLCCRPGRDWFLQHFGYNWYTIHRADYHSTLLAEVNRLGGHIRLGCDVTKVSSEASYAILSTGEKIEADVIVGADGLGSIVRSEILGRSVDPVETGDLAYRVTITKERVEELNDPSLSAFLGERALQIWVGPDKHAVLYPIRNMQQFNLVLIRPDNLAANVHKAEGDIGEMRETFGGWDKRLTKLISCVDSVLKWKICHMDELDTWVKGSVALLGDACHPTLPYQAQGAAMAVEDGATLGILLGLLFKSGPSSEVDQPNSIAAVLEVYESLRKQRTTTIVQGAVMNRTLYHMHDGPECEVRDDALRNVDWHDPQSKIFWHWANLRDQTALMGYDTITRAFEGFETWQRGSKI